MTPGEHSGPNGNPARFPSRPERPARLPGGRKAHRNPQGTPQSAIRKPQPAPRAPKSMRPGHPEAAFAREAKAPPAIETIETLKPET